jgi:AAA family ATP:ADP antiporter
MSNGPDPQRARREAVQALWLRLAGSGARLLHLERLGRGEGRGAWLFAAQALLMMLACYILKTVREPLLLADGTAEMRSYAYAVIALVLLLIVPLYAWVFHRTEPRRFTRLLCLFFLLGLLLFLLAGWAGFAIGFACFVWVGVFSVLFVAHFWAFAADCYGIEAGERVFPLIMTGATLGSLAGPALSRLVYPLSGPWPLMALAAILLGATLPLVGRGADAIPPLSRGTAGAGDAHDRAGLFSGIHLVLTDRYLLLLALMILLLNWINTTGE